MICLTKGECIVLEGIFDNCEIREIGRCHSAMYLRIKKCNNMQQGESSEDLGNMDFDMFIESSARFAKNNKVLLGNSDIFSVLDTYAQMSEDDEDVWDIYGNNEYDIIVDEKMTKLLPLKVLKATFDEIGDVELMLENDISLKVFSDINVPFGLENWMINDNVRHNQYVFENHELGMTGLFDVFKGTVKYNEMHIDFDKPFEHQLENLTEDLIQVEYSGGYTLDIGWYPELKADGKIVVQMIRDYNWDTPIYKEECHDLQSLVAKIETAERIISNNDK